MHCKDIFCQLALYNRWMNEKLYEAAGRLSVEQLNADRSAFFGSVIGTLNHIMLGDTVWMKRFLDFIPAQGQMTAIQSVPKPTSTRDVFYGELHELWAMRQMIDEEIIAYMGELADDQFDRIMSYTNMAGEANNKAFGYLIMHFFNHQTHHRGQATTLLSQMDEDVGVTDMPAMLPDANL